MATATNRISGQTAPETSDGQLALTASQLPPDMMLMKLENEHIMAVAMKTPRDYGKIKQQLFSVIDEFPVGAEQAIYCKPVGKNAAGEMQYARNLSVRAAENIRTAFGFTRVTTTLTRLDDDRVKLSATFVDYCSGNVTSVESICSQMYRTKYGKMARWGEDRFWNVVVKAETSKLRRECILQSIDGALKAAYFDYCDKKLDDILDKGVEEKIITNFASKGLAVEHLEKLIGRPRKLGWTKKDRESLIGVWNALENDETTIDELLSAMDESPEPEKDGAPEAKSAATEAVKGSELETPKKAATPEPKRDDPETVPREMPPRMVQMKEKIEAYKQKGRLEKLATDVQKNEGAYGLYPVDVETVLGWIKERIERDFSS